MLYVIPFLFLAKALYGRIENYHFGLSRMLHVFKWMALISEFFIDFYRRYNR